LSLGKTAITSRIKGTVGYILGPAKLFTLLSGNPTAFMVYLYLLSQAEEWNPSHGQIASATGISKRSVVRAIQRLEELLMFLGDKLAVG
jgi:DNA-binding MarR family transcriptional regulator